MREACRQYHPHWQTPTKILTCEEPQGYRRAKPPTLPTIEPMLPFIREILEVNAMVPHSILSYPSALSLTHPDGAGNDPRRGAW